MLRRFFVQDRHFLMYECSLKEGKLIYAGTEEARSSANGVNANRGATTIARYRSLMNLSGGDNTPVPRSHSPIQLSGNAAVPQSNQNRQAADSQQQHNRGADFTQFHSTPFASLPRTSLHQQLLPMQPSECQSQMCIQAATSRSASFAFTSHAIRYTCVLGDTESCAMSKR
jgi:hypothetical protein